MTTTYANETHVLTDSELTSFLRDCIRLCYMPRSYAATVARGLLSGDIPRNWGDIAEHLDEYPSAAEYALLNAGEL